MNMEVICETGPSVYRPYPSFRTTTSTKFCPGTTVSARKPASFWREKRGTVVILVRGFAKMSSCQNKSPSGFGIFRSGKGSVISNKNI